jgi:hypothetical protein
MMTASVIEISSAEMYMEASFGGRKKNALSLPQLGLWNIL